MNSVLFGNGYWANIVKGKIIGLTNLVTMIDSKTNIDVVGHMDIAFVCCSTSSHYEVIKKCLNSNIKYLFCTKPFTGDYEKAKELYDIAEQKGVNIFVDNLFLFREEIIDLQLKDMRRFSFYWMKSDGREGLFDSLLYHDLYLLLKWSLFDKWKVISGYSNDNQLSIYMNNGCQSCSFKYNVGNGGNKKWIIIDGHVINLSYPKNDPLKECIVNMIEGDIDYDLSRKVTLDTLKLMASIKRQMV